VHSTSNDWGISCFDPGWLQLYRRLGCVKGKKKALAEKVSACGTKAKRLVTVRGLPCPRIRTWKTRHRESSPSISPILLTRLAFRVKAVGKPSGIIKVRSPDSAIARKYRRCRYRGVGARMLVGLIGQEQGKWHFLAGAMT
jgi:hypothetical protein